MLITHNLPQLTISGKPDYFSDFEWFTYQFIKAAETGVAELNYVEGVKDQYGNYIPQIGPGLTLVINQASQGQPPHWAPNSDVVAMVINAGSLTQQQQNILNTDLQQAADAMNETGATNPFTGTSNILDWSLSPDQLLKLYDLDFQSRIAKLSDLLGVDDNGNPLWIDTLSGTSEGAAIYSLYYTTPGVVGPKLIQDLRSGNRAEAWYEIRYDSNGGSGADKNGYAKRRFAESQLFGLYNEDPSSTSIPYDESISIYQMLENHRDKILSYELTYAAQIDNANTDFSAFLGNSGNVQRLSSALKPAEDSLFANLTSFSQYQSFSEITSLLKESSFDAASIYVGGAQANLSVNSAESSTLVVDPNTLTSSFTNNLLLSNNPLPEVLSGALSLGNNLIIDNMGGQDFLIAGSHNDTLVGGGSDTLVGGSGTDIFVVDSSHITSPVLTTIEANSSNGSVWYNNTQITGGTNLTHTIKEEWTDQGSQPLTYDFLPNWGVSDIGTLFITGGLLGNGGIEIDNFDLSKAESDSGFLGIKLAKTCNLSTGVVVCKPGAGTGPNGDPPMASCSEQLMTFSLDAPTEQNQTVTISLSGGNGSYGFSYNNSFVSGNSLTLTIPAGQQQATFSVINTAPNSSAESINVGASFSDGTNTIQSNLITLDVAAGNSTGSAIQQPNDGATVSGQLIYNSQGQPATTATGQQIMEFDPLRDSQGVVLNTDQVASGQSGYANDIYLTGGGNNVITAGSSYDDLMVGAGNNFITAEAGDTVVAGINGSNNITIKDNNPSDSPYTKVYLSNGNDTISTIVDSQHPTSQVDLIGASIFVATDNRTYVTSSSSASGNNTIIGNGAQMIVTLGGDSTSADAVYAGSQVTNIATAIQNAKSANASHAKGDFLSVGDGNDTVIGGLGNDFISVGQGNDVVVAGPGNDTIEAGMVASSTEISTDWSVTTVGRAVVFNAGGTGFVYGATVPQNYEGALEYMVLANGTVVPGIAGGGNHTIFGGTGNDFISASNGNDYIDAGGGNDYIAGGMGADTILGNSGNVTIYGGGGDTYINGGSGNDTLVGQGGNNTIIGGSGSDVIYAGGGDPNWATEEVAIYSNYVYGGSGNSTIHGSSGNDTLVAGTGDTLIEGGSGTEYLVSGGNGHDTFVGGSGVTTIDMGDGDSLAEAGSGSTSIYGGMGSDSIFGGSGNNQIFVGDGSATVEAGSGNTTIYGGRGIDDILGGSGTDILYAGDGGTAAGATTVQAGSGATTIYGGFGYDYLDTGTQGSGGDMVIAGDGETTLVGGNNDTLVAGSGNDVFFSKGATTDLFNPDFGSALVLPGAQGATLDFGQGIAFSDLSVTEDMVGDLQIDVDNGGSITVIGGSSVSSIDVGGSSYNVADFLQQTNATTDNGIDGLLTNGMGSYQFGSSSFSVVDSSTTNNTVNGYADVFHGVVNALTGNNYIDLGGDAPTSWYETETPSPYTYGQGDAGATNQFGAYVIAGAGNDTVMGTSGNDVIIGGEGNNFLAGGSGSDSYRVSMTNASHTTIFDDEFQPDYMNPSPAAVSPNTVVFDDSVTPGSLSYNWQGTDTSINEDNSAQDTGLLTITNGDSTLSIYYGSDQEGRLGEVPGTSYIGVQNFEFADGTQLTLDQFQQQVSHNTVNIINGPAAPGDTSIYGTWLDDQINDESNTGGIALYGAGGNDTLTASIAGNDSLYGGTGNDSLLGSDGNLFDGGAGDDTLDGASSGNNEYDFGNGDGHDLIINGDSSDMVMLKEGVSVADVRIVAGANGSMLLTLVQGNGSDTLSFNAAEIQRIRFYDGGMGGSGYATITIDPAGDVTTTYTTNEFDPVTQQWSSTITGTTVQYADGSTVQTGNSCTTEDGTGKRTTYVYSSSGVLLNDVWAKNDGTYGADTFNSDGSSSGYAYGADGLMTYDYTDNGAGYRTDTYYEQGNFSWQRVTDGTNETITGGDGNQYLVGGSGNNTLSGGSGNDTLVGGSGTNTYQFGAGYGQDVIADANASDVIQVNAAATDVVFSKNSSGQMVLSLTDGQGNLTGDTLTFDPTTVHEVQFAGSNTLWDVNSVAPPTDMNITISSDLSAFTNGSSSNLDGFILPMEQIVGQLLTSESWGVTTIRVLNGVLVDVNAANDPQNQLSLLENHAFYYGNLFGEMVFATLAQAAGTSAQLQYTAEQYSVDGSGNVLLQGPSYTGNFSVNYQGGGTLTGTTGDDFLDGVDAASLVIDGEAGDDTVQGGTGADTVLHYTGDGNDVLTMYKGGGAASLVLVGNGSNTANDVQFVQDQFALKIILNGETITVQDYFHTTDQSVWVRHGELASIQFYTGMADYNSNTMSYEWVPSGNSSNALWQGGTDSRQLATSSRNDNITMWSGAGDLTLDGQAGDDYLKVQDGNNTIIGGTGNDTLIGGSGNDTLDGGTGNDLLIGGAGTGNMDVYQFARGDGVDTVQAAGQGEMQYAADIASDQLWFQQSGNDLVVSIIGTSDSETISNWYLNAANQVGEFVAGDGKVLLAGQVDNLVNAMASFSPPTMGQTSLTDLPSAEQSTVGQAISQNWALI